MQPGSGDRGEATVQSSNGFVKKHKLSRKGKEEISGLLSSFTTVNPISLRVVPGGSYHPLKPQGQALWDVQQAGEKGSQRTSHKEETSCISRFLGKTVTSSTSRWEPAKTFRYSLVRTFLVLPS